MKIDLKQVKIEAEKDISGASDQQKLRQIEKKYLGKKGMLAEVFVGLKHFPAPKRKEQAQAANQVKKTIASLIENKAKQFGKKPKSDLQKVDLTRPGQKIETGHLHLITQTQKEVTDIFKSMGFGVVEGPQVESDWYNFDALNFPKNHPARDMQDTFWLKRSSVAKQKLLLRTHTSPMQVRYMEKHKPPFKIVVPGRVFRNEATDASHEAQFYQLEGLMVDKNISAANFKAVIEEFLTRYFQTDVEIRLRPGFFPFVEPGFEIDAKRKGGDWLELMGAGMVHPNVFKAAGIATQSVAGGRSDAGWTGFAFGVGIERLAMVKHKIPDLRSFYQSDLRFLKQF